MRSISIGRDPESQFSVQDSEVSWKHCVLYERSDGRAELEDLGSTNGTMVNAKRLGEIRDEGKRGIAAGESGFLCGIGDPLFLVCF